jgi:hypothetical protein
VLLQRLLLVPPRMLRQRHRLSVPLLQPRLRPPPRLLELLPMLLLRPSRSEPLQRLQQIRQRHRRSEHLQRMRHRILWLLQRMRTPLVPLLNSLWLLLSERL